MHVAGKPCMLKCHVNYASTSFAKASEVAVSGSFINSNVCVMGRQLDPFSNERAR